MAVLTLALLPAGPANAASRTASAQHSHGRTAKLAYTNVIRKRTHSHSARGHGHEKPVATPTAPTPPTETTHTEETTPSTPPPPPTNTEVTPPVESEPAPPAQPESPVATPPAEGSPSGSLLFSGTRIKDFWLNQSASGAVSETSDPLGGSEKALKMTVKDTDVYPITPTENPRAELLSPTFIKSGDEFWLSTKFMLPTDLPSVPGWLSLVSVYGAPFQGSSPWHVAIDESKLRWQRNETYKYDIPWEAPLIKGSWVSVLCHERFGSDGWVEMWINGQQINFFANNTFNPNHVAATTRLNMKTMDSSNNTGANYAKIMQYREVGMFNTGTVYFSGLKVGTTRASVGA